MKNWIKQKQKIVSLASYDISPLKKLNNHRRINIKTFVAIQSHACMLNKSMQNKKEEMKNQEKIKKQVKEILEKDEEPIVTAQAKAKPKHAKVPRPEPIEYEYEYDETEEPDNLE